MNTVRTLTAGALGGAAIIALVGCAPQGGTAASSSTVSSSAAAPSAAAASTLSPAAERPGAATPEEYFEGDVTLTPLYGADNGRDHLAGSVEFAPGARSNWHSHPYGQTLVVTEGQGWAQDRGGERIELNPGDVLTTPANVEHWHGGTDEEGMTHIAITGDRDGENVEWLETVTDQQYAG